MPTTTIHLRAWPHVTLSAAEGGQHSNGGRIHVWEQVGAAGNYNQVWVYDRASGLIYLAAHPDRVLSAEHHHANGAKVWFWDRVGPAGNDNQQWTINPDGSIALRHHQHLLLSMRDGHDNGADVHLWERVGHGHPNQTWIASQ